MSPVASALVRSLGAGGSGSRLREVVGGDVVGADALANGDGGACAADPEDCTCSFAVCRGDVCLGDRKANFIANAVTLFRVLGGMAHGRPMRGCDAPDGFFGNISIQIVTGVRTPTCRLIVIRNFLKR